MKKPLTPSQAFYHRNRWARFVLYTLAFLGDLTMHLLKVPCIAAIALCGSLHGSALGIWRTVLRRYYDLYARDWKHFDEIRPEFEENTDARD
jgi:hypothetical protein